MVVLFVDIFNDEFSRKNYIIKVHNNIISVKFNKKILDSFNSRKFYLMLKNKLIFKNFNKILKSKIKENNIASCICSKDLDNMKDIKKRILNNILSQSFTNIYESKEKNMIFNSLDKYLNKYILDNCIEKGKVKILYIIDELNNDIYSSVLENINKFKYIDLTFLGDYNSLEYTKIIKKIELINNELGSSIEVIKPRYDMDYNVYYNFTNIDFKNKYMLNNISLYVECLQTEKDEFNKYNIAFKNNSYVLKVILNKLGCNIQNYNITKIGNLILNNIIKC